MKFEVINAPHQIGKKVHLPGSRIESDDDLCQLFPNKFRMIGKKPPPPEAPTPEEVEEEQLANIPADTERTEGIEDEWQDATAKFDGAAEAKVTVVEKKGKFNLFYGDDRTHPLNDKPMTKKQAEKYIKDMEPESEDDSE